MEQLDIYLKKGYGRQEVTINEELDSHNTVQVLHVYSNVDPKKIVKQVVKSGIYDSLDVGAIWLDQCIKENPLKL